MWKLFQKLNTKQLPIKWGWVQTDKMQTERQTNCRRVWTADEYKRRSKRKGEREKCTSGPSSKWGQKSYVYGSIGCSSQSQTRMTAEKGAGLTWDDFARIFNSDQWPSCISLYRTLIRLYLHRYHCYLFYREQ